MTKHLEVVEKPQPLEVEKVELPVPTMASISSRAIVVEVARGEDSVVRVDLTILSEPLTDEDVEMCFRSFKEGVEELAKRRKHAGQGRPFLKLFGGLFMLRARK